LEKRNKKTKPFLQLSNSFIFLMDVSKAL